MTTTYDACVIGLGAMGSAALYQLAKRSKSVLGIDRYNPPTPMVPATEAAASPGKP